MRLGIFGGSFDPVHYGHLLLAESCREQLALDRVWFVPAAVPPHKQQATPSPAVHRLEMLRLAIGGHEAFELCTYEIDRGGVNYTVDTLRHLLTENPGHELFFLMGADSLRDLPTWREPAEICRLATLGVVARWLAADGSNDLVDYSPLQGLVSTERLAEIRAQTVTMPRIDLSSTEIRRRVAAGQSIRYQTPRAVERYIAAHRLYAS